MGSMICTSDIRRHSPTGVLYLLILHTFGTKIGVLSLFAKRNQLRDSRSIDPIPNNHARQLPC